MVPKGETGKFRLVGNYRVLNQQTIPDLYPTPSVQHLLYRLHGSTIFSKIDLVRAYHQIPLSSESRKKTAIICPLGLFEYIFLPFGLRNASSTFQRFIDQVCHGLTHVIPYIDDIIFSANEDDHLVHLQELFERLDQYGIVVNPTKSLFGQPEITFLGHAMCKEGVKPTKEKVDAILRNSQFSMLSSYVVIWGWGHTIIVSYPM